MVYALDSQADDEPTLDAQDKRDDLLDVWPARFEDVHRFIIKCTAEKGADRDIDMTKPSLMVNCSSCIPKTMTVMPMRSPTEVEVQTWEMVRTDVAEINDLSLKGEKYFVTIISEAPSHVMFFHGETKYKASKLLKRYERLGLALDCGLSQNVCLMSRQSI